MTPIRLNLLLIAGGVLLIAITILNLIPQILAMGLDGGPLIIGTLIGLLGSCITGLSGLGTTLMNDRTRNNKRRDNERDDDE